MVMVGISPPVEVTSPLTCAAVPVMLVAALLVRVANEYARVVKFLVDGAQEVPPEF